MRCLAAGDFCRDFHSASFVFINSLGIDHVVRLTAPPSMTAIQELVVPRSMPKTFAINLSELPVKMFHIPRIADGSAGVVPIKKTKAEESQDRI